MTERITLRNLKKSYYINFNSIVITFIAIILCVCTIRNGNEKFEIHIWAAIIIIDALAAISLVNNKVIAYGKEAILLIIGVTIPFLFQIIIKAPYYSVRSAFWGIILFIAFLCSATLIVQPGYGKTIFKTINFFNLFAASCIIIQMIFYYLGIRLDRYGQIGEIFFNAWEFTTSFRPCGVCVEPSQFAEMALLSVFYYMFINKNFKKLFVLIAGILLSTSMLGLLGLALLIMLYIWKYYIIHGRLFFKIFAFIITLVIIVILMSTIVYRPDMISVGYDKVLVNSSLGLRVNRSFELFNIMNLRDKLFGIGIQNQQLYLNFHSIVLPSDTYETISNHREFANTIGYMLCTCGLTGCMFFIYYIYICFKKQKFEVKVIVLLFLYIAAFCCIFSRSIFLMYFVAMYSIRDMVCENAVMVEHR